jgi:hypothetical protein
MSGRFTDQSAIPGSAKVPTLIQNGDISLEPVHPASPLALATFDVLKTKYSTPKLSTITGTAPHFSAPLEHLADFHGQTNRYRHRLGAITEGAGQSLEGGHYTGTSKDETVLAHVKLWGHA